MGSHLRSLLTPTLIPADGHTRTHTHTHTHSYVSCFTRKCNNPAESFAGCSDVVGESGNSLYSRIRELLKDHKGTEVWSKTGSRQISKREKEASERNNDTRDNLTQ